MTKEAGEEAAPVSAAVAAARAALTRFFELNPLSSLEEVIKDGTSEVQICQPWGDSSVGIRLPAAPSPVHDALNNLVLPDRLTAIWHQDTKDLEVIWTALRLPKSQKEIKGRKFQFIHKGKKHTCQFKKSSSRLLDVAKCFVPKSISDTNFRNLVSFYNFANVDKESRERLAIEEPLSFWVSNISWDENKSVDLINNLNFYLTYYDDQSSTIALHAPKDSLSKKTQKTRYIANRFPSKIQGHGLDNNLLSFWNAGQTSNPMMKFIIYYRIIEYASIQHVDRSVRTELKRILSAPDRGDDVVLLMAKVTDAMRADKLDDIARLKGTIRETVDPRLIWREVAANKDFFSAEKVFDGGFKVRAFITRDEKEETFCARGLDGFADALRKIRNALSHGKDLETAGVITPTTRNLQLLLPWVHLIGTAAGEVVIYKDVT